MSGIDDNYISRQQGRTITPEMENDAIDELNNAYGYWGNAQNHSIDDPDDNYGLSFSTTGTKSPAVARMENLGNGRLPMEDPDGGYGCTRAIGMVYNHTPFQGVTQVDQIQRIANSYGKYQPYVDSNGVSGQNAQPISYSDYVKMNNLRGGDVILMGNEENGKWEPYAHAAMVGDHPNSVLQNGVSRGTVYTMQPDNDYWQEHKMIPTGFARLSDYNNVISELNDADEIDEQIMAAFRTKMLRDQMYRQSLQRNK